MNPKEKAKELVGRTVFPFLIKTKHGNLRSPFISGRVYNYMEKEISKRSALIAVEEIINSHPQKPQFITIIDTHGIKEFIHDYPADLYWQEVKQEIEKL